MPSQAEGETGAGEWDEHLGTRKSHSNQRRPLSRQASGRVSLEGLAIVLVPHTRKRVRIGL